jgi:hypothetical protein
MGLGDVVAHFNELESVGAPAFGHQSTASIGERGRYRPDGNPGWRGWADGDCPAYQYPTALPSFRASEPPCSTLVFGSINIP